MTDPLPPLTSADLADLKAKVKAATPGEWESVTHDDPRGQPVPYYRALICTVEHSPDRHLSVVAKNGNRISRGEWEANTKHIAATNPETILRLIDMIERRDAWQPIETAPRTSHAILVWCPERKNTYMVTWYDKEGWRAFGGYVMRETPTHWQPLPAPPSEALAATEPVNDKR